MADKYITLHPNNNGVLDTTTNIYPNVKAAHNLLKENGDTFTPQERLVSGENIRPIRIGSSTQSPESLLGSSDLVINLLGLLYPVGTIYTCTTDATIEFNNADEPICPIQTLLGGVWVPIHEKFLYAAKKGTHNTGGDRFAGDTGGSDKITINANNLPAHTHPINITGSTTNTSKTLTGFMTAPQGDNYYAGSSIPGINLSNTDGVGGIVSKVRLDEPDPVSCVRTLATQEPAYALNIDATHSHNINFSGNTDNNDTSAKQDITHMPQYMSVYAWYRVE